VEADFGDAGVEGIGVDGLADFSGSRESIADGTAAIRGRLGNCGTCVVRVVGLMSHVDLSPGAF